MKKQSFVEALLFIVAVIWALNFSVIKSSLEEIDPFSFNGLRFLIAAVFIWIVLLWRKERIRIPRSDWLPLLGMGLLGNLVYQGLFIIGIDLTLSANAAVMLGTIPVWVGILSHLFSIEKMDILKGIGVVFAFAGIVFIIGGGTAGFSVDSQTLLGDLIIVAAAVVWAAYTILSKSFLSDYTPLQFSAITSAIGCVVLMSLAFPWMRVLDWSSVSYMAYGGVIYSGLLSIGLAYIIWNYGLQVVGTVRTATFQNLVPVFGLVFGVLLLNEHLGLMQYMGSAFVIAGIVLARFQRKTTALQAANRH
ncbi:MAG: DMT family transporter [Balneolaceae bacterium]